MASLYFKLRKDKINKKGLCPLHLIYEHDGKSCRLSMEMNVRPENFNTAATDNWFKPTEAGHVEQNMILASKLERVKKLQNRFFLDNQDRYPTAKEMQELHNIQVGISKPVDKSFFTLFHNFQRYQDSRGSESVADGTAINYRKFKARMLEYQEYIKRPMSFEEINKQFYRTFIAYLCDEHGNGVNSCGASIKILKTFLYWCENQGEIVLDKAVMKTLKVTSEQNWKVFLTIDEMDRVAALDLTNNPTWDIVRDGFILQFYIGCRYSDMQNLREENIVFENGKYIVRQTTVKTRKLTQTVLSQSIPLKILEKYKGTAVKDWVPNLQKFNKHIKDICKAAKVTQEIVLAKGTGVHRKDAVKAKCDLVASHTARISFINLMLKAGVPDATIALSTGQSIKTLQGYKHGDFNDLDDASNAFDKLR